jgi:hypothetical protein
MRIAKKARSVKRQKRAEPLPPPRYTIRKDALDRRYAIDKRTGQRVSLQKAEKERVKRRKVAQAIPQHKAPKAKKPNKTRSVAAKRAWKVRKERIQARSEAAKRGWQSRRERMAPSPVAPAPIAPVPSVELIPPGLTLVPLAGNSADRAELYPKVKQALEYAFARIQQEGWEKRAALFEGKPPPKLTREEQIKSNIRDLIVDRIQNTVDIDRVVAELYDELDGEYSQRDLYEIYFSPEVA